MLIFVAKSVLRTKNALEKNSDWKNSWWKNDIEKINEKIVSDKTVIEKTVDEKMINEKIVGDKTVIEKVNGKINQKIVSENSQEKIIFCKTTLLHNIVQFDKMSCCIVDCTW